MTLAPPRLDLIVPTHNRSALLLRLLESVELARPPAALSVAVTVVDNNSTDATAATVRAFAERAQVPIRYLFESRPGKSSAQNRGLAETDGELVGFVDDDEELDESWLLVVERELADAELDFIGGPYRPRWVIPAPPWLPPGYGGIIGVNDPGGEPRPFDAAFPGLLLGGNAVLRRTVLERVGPFNPALGRGSTAMGSCEDSEMYQRLLAAGARGRYVPDLLIRHFIAPERLTKRYHRRWAYGNGRSLAVLDRERPETVARVGRLPRHMLGSALRGLAGLAQNPGIALRDEARRFGEELQWWGLVGFLREAYRRRSDSASTSGR